LKIPRDCSVGDRLSDRKIIITGRGRAGTTCLVAVLSDLGLDTGFRAGVPMDGHSGGLERSLGDFDTPRIVKSPGFCTRLGKLLDDRVVEIEHVIIPMRDFDVAAASRARVAGYGRFLGVRGGFLGTRSASRQRRVLITMLAELLWTVTRHDLPHTFLEFPRFAHDWQYTYEKLGFLDPALTADDFRVALEKRYDPSEIRQEPLTARERATAAALQPWTLARRVWIRLGRKGAPPTITTPSNTPRRVSTTVRRSAGARLGPVRKLLGSSRMWRLWRARNLQRRARGPLEGPNEWSVIAAPKRNEKLPSDELVAFAMRAIERARRVDLKTLHERISGDSERLDHFSGQHYRILAGLAEAWDAKRLVEIGTYQGMSALALLESRAIEQLVTYDLVAWDKLGGTLLRRSDFGDRLQQRLGDLSDPNVFAAATDVLKHADMLFIDASKDGVFEPAFLAELFKLEPAQPQLIVLDDIRVLTMVRVWNDIALDKFDLTSFGHWSGTGIIVRGGFPPGPRD
jgi:predicted O-methyltransferase YrrM